jgi:hypothetical protein
MCLGTPEDIVRLINAGYAVLLRRLSVRVVLVNMQRILNIGMVQLMSDSAGCALYKDGRCLVHDLGLKPTEGRYFIHPRSKAGEALMGTLTLAVVLEWIEDKNRMAAGYCFSKVTAG